jgi:hypothetical protein
MAREMSTSSASAKAAATEVVANVDAVLDAPTVPESTVTPTGVSISALSSAPQRPYKSLEEFDWKEFPFLDGRRVSTSDDGKSVTVYADNRDNALSAASNVIAVAGGDFELISSYEDSTDEEKSRWKIVVARKEQ